MTYNCDSMQQIWEELGSSSQNSLFMYNAVHKKTIISLKNPSVMTISMPLKYPRNELFKFFIFPSVLNPSPLLLQPIDYNVLLLLWHVSFERQLLTFVIICCSIMLYKNGKLWTEILKEHEQWSNLSELAVGTKHFICCVGTDSKNLADFLGAQMADSIHQMFYLSHLILYERLSIFEWAYQSSWDRQQQPTEHLLHDIRLCLSAVIRNLANFTLPKEVLS